MYTIYTSPKHAPVPDHLPTLVGRSLSVLAVFDLTGCVQIVTPAGKPQNVLYTYLHTNYNQCGIFAGTHTPKITDNNSHCLEQGKLPLDALSQRRPLHSQDVSFISYNRCRSEWPDSWPKQGRTLRGIQSLEVVYQQHRNCHAHLQTDLAKLGSGFWQRGSAFVSGLQNQQDQCMVVGYFPLAQLASVFLKHLTGDV